MGLEVPGRVAAAAHDRRSGAAEIALQAVEGLLEVAGDPARLEAAVRVLLEGQPAMAPVWHLARAARSADPARALTRLREGLRTEADEAVAAAVAWLDRHAGPEAPAATVSHSSLVERVLAGRPRAAPDAGARVAVIGADAIGPAAVLNARGSAALAARLPTLVVATTVKLVPGGVFDRLAAPGFERVGLGSLAAVVLGAEVVSPSAAGCRAAAADR